MKGTLTTIRTNGSVTSQEVSGHSLDLLQKAVGGSIETVPYFDKFRGENAVAFCNEEGKLLGAAFNARATRLWHEQIAIEDVLCGDIVVVQGDNAFMETL